MAQSFALTFDTAALDRAVDEDEKACEEAARPAAQAGAQVLYDAVKLNVAGIGRKSGNLAASIYQAYSTHRSEPGIATYHVSWNPRKAPHGHLLENGYIQRYQVVLSAKTGRWITLKNKPLPAPKHVAAHAFVLPAIAHFPQALDAMEKKFLEVTGYATK